jgi:hypothetical protein
MKNIFNIRFALLAGLIVLAALTRLINHPANVSPVMAIAIFGGALFNDKRMAFIAPLLAMALSDIFLGFHFVSIFVYIGFVVGIYIGFMIKNNLKVQNIILATLSGSLIFFILTNLGAWVTDPVYMPLSYGSLANCFTLAIPFFRNTLAGDFVYVTVLFGSFSLATKYVPVLQSR